MMGTRRLLLAAALVVPVCAVAQSAGSYPVKLARWAKVVKTSKIEAD